VFRELCLQHTTAAFWRHSLLVHEQAGIRGGAYMGLHTWGEGVQDKGTPEDVGREAPSSAAVHSRLHTGHKLGHLTRTKAFRLARSIIQHRIIHASIYSYAVRSSAPATQCKHQARQWPTRTASAGLALQVSAAACCVSVPWCFGALLVLPHPGC
jgi:hypothetical protein